MISLLHVQEAAARIKDYRDPTPLIRARPLENLLSGDNRVFLKCENLQVTRSFKPRGAMNRLLQLSPEERERGVLARSSGNFAQAVAFGAHVLDLQATIVMPLDAPATKIESTRNWGAEIVLHGTTHPEGNEKATELSASSGATLLHPYDCEMVIAGQGTVGLEILEDLPAPGTVIGPIGGGGLLGGTALALKESLNSVTVVGVEPAGGADYFESCKRGERFTLSEVNTIADGLKAPAVGEHNWPVLQRYVDDVRIVTDADIIGAMQLIYREMGMIIEPSGACSVAALVTSSSHLNGDIVCILSGGNVDLARFEEWRAVSSS